MPLQQGNSQKALLDGVQACRRGEWHRGLHVLSQLTESRKKGDEALPSIFYSYLGVAMARCEGRKRDAIELCRYAVKRSPRDPENRANLATAYLIARNRRQAVKQLYAGLKFAPHNRLLHELGREIGIRRPPAIPFLSRNNFLNMWIGRLTYDPDRDPSRLESIDQEEEEEEEEEDLLTPAEGDTALPRRRVGLGSEGTSESRPRPGSWR